MEDSSLIATLPPIACRTCGNRKVSQVENLRNYREKSMTVNRIHSYVRRLRNEISKEDLLNILLSRQLINIDQYRQLAEPQYSAYDIGQGYQFDAPTSGEILDLLHQRELITPEVLNAYNQMNLTPDEALDRYLKTMNMDTFFNQMGIKRYCCRQTFMNPDTFPVGGIGYSHQVPEMILDREQQEARQLGMTSSTQRAPAVSLGRIDVSNMQQLTNQMGTVTLGSTVTGGNVVSNVFAPNPRAKLYRVGRPPRINIMPDYSREYTIIERSEPPTQPASPAMGRLSRPSPGGISRPSPGTLSRPPLSSQGTIPLSVSTLNRPPLSAQQTINSVPRTLGTTALSTMRRSMAPRVIRSDNP